MHRIITCPLMFLFLLVFPGCSSDPSKTQLPPVKEKVEFKASEPSTTKPLGLGGK